MKTTGINKYGIEYLKKLAQVLINLGVKFEGFVFSWRALLKLLPFFITNGKLIVELWQNKEKIKLEIEDLKPAEKQELYDFIEVKFDLQNDKIEAIIEAAIEFLFDLEKHITKLRKLLKNG